MVQTVIPAAVPGIYWQWQGHSIYYVRAGSSDRPPLVLVHGFGASTDHWRKNVAELQADFEVWAIDLLGFGRSAKPDLVYDGGLWREQLHAFLTEVVRRPAVLAGNSLGGYAVLAMAAKHPEWASGLVLLNSAGPFGDNSETTMPTRNNPLQALFRDGLRSLLLQPWASFLLFQYVRQRWVIRRTLEQVYVDRGAVTPELIEDIYRPSCDRGAPQVFAAVFKTPQGDPLDVLLPQVRCPVLLLWGEGDPWMRVRERSPRFREFLPEASEVFVPAGHCPHDEAPERVNAHIREWVVELLQ
ncbi:alpha/beta fold hydrolase [Rubidibacter lacunae]|nr:alpha/beta fold hydrolase [Rubidibacter lacunae]